MTEQIKERDDWQDENIFNQRIEHFIKQYEPRDERDRSQFHMHLHDLMRCAYGLAAKPYERTMQSMLKSLPIVNFIPTEKKS